MGTSTQRVRTTVTDRKPPSHEQPLEIPTKILSRSINNHRIKHASEGRGSNHRQYENWDAGPCECWDRAIDRRSPRTLSPRMRVSQSPANPEIGIERDAGSGSENDDVHLVRCSTLRVYRENSPPNRFLWWEKNVRGINKRDNEYSRTTFSDGTNEYWYKNRDGSFYQKHRDGSAYFRHPRGFAKHYPAPVPGQSVKRKGRGGGSARVVSSRYRISQNAPATRQEDTKQLPVNSTKNRIEGGN